MIKITVDTNILVSATIVEGNEFELLKLAKKNKIKLILSLEILNEFKEVILRSKFNYSDELVEDIVKEILEVSEIVFPIKKLYVIKDDPDDNIILECAETGKVNYIVSGDEHLLSLKEYKNIKIVRTSLILSLFEK